MKKRTLKIMSKHMGTFLARKYQEVLEECKNDMEDLLKTLKPINALLLPLRDQNIISIIYRQHTSQCNECGHMFPNNYLRDFHQIHVHKINMQYTCYQCYGNSDLEESDMYFSSIYLLHAHRIEYHDDPDYKIETQQLMQGI